MKQKPLGNSGLSASIVGLGAWVLGGGQLWGQDTDDAESVRTIQAALDLGINLIDTAPAYGWGRSERVVGRALKGRRDRAILATKCGLWWEDARGSFFTDFDGKKLYRSLRPDTLQLEIENSLRRLETDYIDLYQTHWPSVPPDHTPIADTMAVLLKFKDQGKIRAIGVCNVSLDELKENLRCGGIVSDQFRYSMLHREAEADILPFCAQHQIATLTYMSLEQGLLTGKIGMDRVFKPTEFRSNTYWNDWLIPVNRKRVLDLLASWKDLTDKYACTLSQLVIAWTAAQHGVTHVLAGGRNLAQVSENAKAGDLTLEAADLARIRKDVIALGAPAKA
ncbi:MAG TPA: aldo/keto reductase [Candidatus Paceibacterota bacterium]|nr:aldo/keto reductase [Candidatus Paceibacterota bacterium]